MEEALESGQGTPLLTLFKAVCKKWLLIGFLAVFGGLLGCIYAFAALPLTKDIYEVNLFLSPSNPSADNNVINYYNDQNIANIKSYLNSAGYKNNVFTSIQNDIFTDIADLEKREDEFKKAVSVPASVPITVYVMNQERAVAETILNAFVKEAERFVDSMMDKMNEGNLDESKIVGIAVVSGNVIKSDSKGTDIQGYIGQSSRIIAVAVGALLGLAAGAAAAVCIYYFNNRLNSVQMLNSMGFTQVYIDKKNKNGSASVYDENTIRYNFEIDKKEGKVITFISPVETEETAMARAEQAESMRKYGYRVLEIGQKSQTREQWKEVLTEAVSGNDFILVHAAAAHNFDCAVPGALSDGVTVVIDQKNTRLKQLKHTKEIIDTAKLKALAVYIVNLREDFIQ